MSKPTLFRVLVQERRWSNWAVFCGHFEKAGRDLARETGESRLASVTVGRRTFDRWFAGDWYGRPQLDAGRVLERLLGFPSTELFSPAPDVFGAGRMVHHRGDLSASLSIGERWPTSRLFMSSGETADSWEFAGRSVLDGTTSAVQFHQASVTGQTAQVQVSDGELLRRFLRPARRGLLVAVEEGEETEHPRMFVIDAGNVRRTMQSFPSASGMLKIPVSQELDDFTYGLLWSLIQLDDGLLADDQALDEEQRLVDAFLPLPRSAVSRETQPGLTQVGSHWLGSAFCARHVLRRLDGVSEPPVFWTQEQTGEQAAAWLFFEHKIAYLRALAQRFGGAATPMTRTFCLPESEVSGSSRYEKVLLFLAIALMEYHGIHVRVTGRTEYAAVDGFALASRDRAVVANWVRAEGIWRADTVTARPDLRGYQEITGDAAASGVIESATSVGRLRALADYLALDWQWLVRRCEELGDSGVAGLARPRSRLITLDGLDRVLQYVGGLSADA
jgi:hypothetical protein